MRQLLHPRPYKVSLSRSMLAIISCLIANAAAVAAPQANAINTYAFAYAITPLPLSLSHSISPSLSLSVNYFSTHNARWH